MSSTRTEKDLLGSRDIPAHVLTGIHTARAEENFPLAMRPVRAPLIHAYGAVKLACARANHELGRWDDDLFQAICSSCEEMVAGKLDEQIRVDALQGGAGTSTNMNVNEVLTNRALQLLGKQPGDYSVLHPNDDLNRSQSTNDTYPTALRIACINEMHDLERRVVALQEAFQSKEREFSDIVKVARTEMQDACLTTLGRTFGAFSEPLARDRWRIYKCEERLRVVNLGGTAIGTGLGAPRKFIFRATDILREITGLGLARAENLVDATQNTDVFVEVSGILRALASSLIKICGDLRLLSSGPMAGIGEIALPARQAGSSIMPGKVNPVIPEAVTQAALMVLGYDQTLTMACSMGSLELNAFFPLIADCLLGSIELMANGCDILRTRCVEGITARPERCRELVETGGAVFTALVDKLGYARAQELAECAARENRPAREITVESGYLTAEEFDFLTSVEQVMRLGTG